MRRLILVVLPLVVAVLAWPARSSAAANKLLPNAIVKSLTASSLVVTADGKDTTFTVDTKTRVVGKGVGTKAAKGKGKAAITELLNQGDRVTVTYQESGAVMRASAVELVAKGK